MRQDTILAHLYVIRAQVDALILAMQPEPQNASGCPHPADKQLDATVAGGPRRLLCLVCNEERDA